MSAHSYTRSRIRLVRYAILLLHTIALPIFISVSIPFFLNILFHAHYLLIAALTRLGLYKPPPEESTDSAATPNNYILILATVKSRIPIVEFQQLHLRREEQSRHSILKYPARFAVLPLQVSPLHHSAMNSSAFQWLGFASSASPEANEKENTESAAEAPEESSESAAEATGESVSDEKRHTISPHIHGCQK